MIGDLSTASALSSGDKFVIYSASDGTYEVVTTSQLKTWLQSNLSFAGGWTSQYSAPATGATVTFGSGSTVAYNAHLILTPSTTLASLTVALPPASGCLDGQLAMVNCTQVLTSLTVSANGATAVTGAPTTLAQNGYFTMKYDKPTLTWYRVG